ncbi:hypothetical protein QP858_07995 [Trueperella bernardiae]|uniref:Uncharacterized protein n=1 Tax=Trueperella bernardiae TaxID=59561 RepID=A0AAW6ZGK1_9ACTO|nr:hypothetical protein [Micrococcus luteus]MDK8526503.1 hypothetical protein [Micrococcus luteus]MDK8602395.1 hypothetical protein [Trueperella bernardiae]
MSEPNDSNVQVIENAYHSQIRPGDHVTWEWSRVRNGVTITDRLEGVAAWRDGHGEWITEDGDSVTAGEGEGITITVRRPVQELPTEDGVVIVPADGHESITTTDGQMFARLTFTTKKSIWYGPNIAAQPGDYVIQTTSRSRITPGTWKVDDQ